MLNRFVIGSSISVKERIRHESSIELGDDVFGGLEP